MKVYVITHGKYSDYHICAIAATKEMAEKLRVFYSDQFDQANIGEWEVEENLGERQIPNRKYYTVEKDRSGKLYITNEFYWDGYGVDMFVGYYNGYYEVNVMADDEDSALKIGADKIAQYEAERLGL